MFFFLIFVCFSLVLFLFCVFRMFFFFQKFLRTIYVCRIWFCCLLGFSHKMFKEKQNFYFLLFAFDIFTTDFFVVFSLLFALCSLLFFTCLFSFHLLLFIFSSHILSFTNVFLLFTRFLYFICFFVKMCSLF